MGETDNRDYLTGLYNRKGLTEEYNALPRISKVHIMFCDLDNFKSVNDIYGHAAGDRLLIAVGDLLVECAPNAVVCRQSGDEFILLFTSDETRDDLQDIATRIIQEIGSNNNELEMFTLISVSIGIVWNQTAEDGLGQILHKSDAAMYQAKNRGKNCYVFFDELEEQINQEQEMEALAEEALANGNFKIKYRPVINTQSSYLEQVHADVYWEKEDGTFWTQEEFRPLLERNTFIRRVDSYIFEEVCKSVCDFRTDDSQKFKVNILLSRLLFLDDKLGDKLVAIMDKYGVEMSEIEIAISESAFENRGMDRILRSLHTLRRMGFSIALDHFGVDFSSFRYLRRLPVHTVCFDVNYLRENIKNSRGRQIIKTLLRLGRDLKMLMVADGIENQDEVVFLTGCGCDAVSGTYYSDHMEKDEFIKYARERARHQNKRIDYAFKGTLEANEEGYAGEIVGDVRYTEGISDNWGALSFPGGGVSQNIVKLPGKLFSEDSFTVSLWVKPRANWTWGSVFYAGYMGGFASLVPLAGEGISIFRIYEDGDLNGWHDILCRTLDLNKWMMLTVTYDAYSESTRYYMDGVKTGYQVNVPVMYNCLSVILGGDPFQKSFTGEVSGLMIFDRAQTEAEVSELYQSFRHEPGFKGQEGRIETNRDPE